MSTYQKPCYMNKQEFEAWCYRLFTTFCKDIGWTTERVKNYIEANIVQEYTHTFDVPGNPIVVYFYWDHSFIRVTNIITGKTGVAKLRDGDEYDYIIGLALAYARYTKTRIPILVKDANFDNLSWDSVLVNKYSKIKYCYSNTPDEDHVVIVPYHIIKTMGWNWINSSTIGWTFKQTWQKTTQTDFYDATDEYDFNNIR